MKHKNLRVDKEFVSKKNTEFLELIKKEVPKYDWELSRIESKGRWWSVDTYGNKTFKNHNGDSHLHHNVTWIYQCEVNITPKERVIGNIKINYNGSGNYDLNLIVDHGLMDEHKKYVGDTDGKWNRITESQRWELVREFFNSFMIDRDEIVKNQIPLDLNNLFFLCMEHNTTMFDIDFKDLKKSLKSIKSSIQNKFLSS